MEYRCQRTTVTISPTGPAYVPFVLQSHPLCDSSLSSSSNSGGTPPSEGAGEQSNKVVVEDLEEKYERRHCGSGRISYKLA